jgi:hypothetical protein
MKRFSRALALAAALALMLSALPALASAPPSQLVGAWLEDGALGSTVVYLGGYGSYLVWRSWQPFVESGTYTADARTLTLSQYEGAATAWDYTLSGGLLSVYNAPSGAMLNLQRFELGVPEPLLGFWEGSDDQYGPFELNFMEFSEFDEFYFDDATYIQGIFIANDSTVAMGYPDGFVWQNAYRVTGEGQDAELSLYDPQTGELRMTLTRPQPQASPEATLLPTDAPAFTAGPLFTAQPETTEQPLLTPRPGLPAGLAGAWRGEGSDGTHVIVLREDGTYAVTYDNPATPGLEGTMVVGGDTLDLALPDGSTETLRYILMGDSLLLADTGLQNAVTYARTQLPAATDAPVLPTDAPPLPTDAPDAGAMDPALVGTWGGFSFGEYFELTIREDGTYDYLALPDETLSHSGRATARDGQLVLTYEGGVSQYAFYLDNGVPVLGDENRLLRLDGPLARLPLTEGPAAMTADPALTGVWGGIRGEAYEEHAFLADGTYQLFAFLPEPGMTQGNYMAGNGSVAILTADGSKLAAFSVQGDTLTLTFAGEEPIQLTRKPGTRTRPVL